MRIVLLFSMFVIWSAASTGATVRPWVEPQTGVSLFVSGYCVLVAVVAFLGRQWTRRLGGAGPVARPARFYWLLESARYLIPAWFAAGVYLLGWRPMVDRLAGTWLETPGTLLGLLPGLLAWAGLWWASYPVDQAVREMNVVYDVEAGLPVFAFPSLMQYVGNRFRAQVLFTTLPVLMVLVVHDAAVAVWTGLLHRAGWTDVVDGLVSIAAVGVVVIVSPAVLRHVLQTTPMPTSSLRDRLTKVGESAGIRCRDILLWNTHYNSGNAAVMGLIRPVRYVMLSDLLVESMTDLQIQAVFAHELGHVRHRHLVWFVLFFAGVGGAIFAIADWFRRSITTSESGQTAVELACTAAGMAVLLVGFGFLSRWFERQADVFATRSAGSAAGDVEAGAHIFASALQRVAIINNITPGARNWTHGSITKRMAYVMKLATDPAEAERFDRRGRRVIAGLAAASAAGAVVAVILAV